MNLERFIVVTVRRPEAWNSEEHVHMFEDEETTKVEIGRHSALKSLKLKSVFKVDLDRGKIEELEPVFENMEFKLKKKK